MSELIDKQAAVDIAKELTITVEGYEMHNQAVMNYCAEIMQLPSVQPDIITCGDCKRYIRHDKRCGCWNHGVKPTMWCSQAERREVTE